MKKLKLNRPRLINILWFTVLNTVFIVHISKPKVSLFGIIACVLGILITTLTFLIGLRREDTHG